MILTVLVPSPRRFAAILIWCDQDRYGTTVRCTWFLNEWGHRVRYEETVGAQSRRSFAGPYRGG